ncbi:xylosyltransferase 1-like [Lethenteron reissneri]|uniref:xylosyltransferase 1-like n=1 Tax=Lethenteron reissneri TaxID=7753 RepID=UPI002AB7873E|nr:xylosyltransferase 1-like [Lethenteron reissneri]
MMGHLSSPPSPSTPRGPVVRRVVKLLRRYRSAAAVTLLILVAQSVAVWRFGSVQELGHPEQPWGGRAGRRSRAQLPDADELLPRSHDYNALYLPSERFKSNIKENVKQLDNMSSLETKYSSWQNLGNEIAVKNEIEKKILWNARAANGIARKGNISSKLWSQHHQKSLGSIHGIKASKFVQKDIKTHGGLTSNNIKAVMVGGNSLRQNRAKTKASTEESQALPQPISATPCKIVEADALSAMSRAQSRQCKEELAAVVCLHQQGRLMPEELPRTCPLKEKKPGVSVQWLQEEAARAALPAKRTRPAAAGEAASSSPVRVAFVLAVHGRASRQLLQMFRAIYHASHFYYIHVDKRSNYLYKQVLGLAQRYENVRVTSWRMSTIWGGASLLTMYLRAMSDLMAMDDWPWDFFINLSGSDYPIRSNNELVAFLTKYKDKNFLKSHGRETEKFIKKQGLNKVFHECDEHMWRVGERKMPAGIAIDGGSDWFAVTRQFVSYIIHSKSRLVSQLKQFYAFALLPAESFFHTLLVNSEHCATLVDNNLRMTNWNRKLGCKCQYKHIVDWCGCSPNDFKIHDLPRFQQLTRPTFFARKFEAVVSQGVLTGLDAALFGGPPLPSGPSLQAYWENAYDERTDSSASLGDAALTIYQGLFRLGVAQNAHQTPRSGSSLCSYEPVGHPTAAHVYFSADRFQGILVQQRASHSASRHEEVLETWAYPSNHYKVYNSTLLPRLQKMEVGTDWDPKERVFRNFGGLLGPWEQPVAVQHWVPGANVTVTVVWLDPAGVIAASYDAPVRGDLLVTLYRPPLRLPLRPGAWSVRLLVRWRPVAEVSFMVCPLAFLDGQPMTKEKAAYAHMGPPQNKYLEQSFQGLRRVLKLPVENTGQQEANEHALLTDKALWAWIENLISRFWVLADTCSVSESSVRLGCQSLPPCRKSVWSSHYPDPKSELGPVQLNGTIRH